MTLRALLSMLAPLPLLAAAWPACAPPGGKAGWSHPDRSRSQYVVLDGRRTQVFWNDGDSFRVLEGPDKDLRARLAGYNTLESYGPVHFWGGFDGYDLYDAAVGGKKLARSREWRCSTRESSGGYGRALVDCPELRHEIVSEGYAHVFHVGEGGPDEDLVRAQLEAQRERRGMWEWTIPATIVTSMHSLAEDPSKGNSYNRVCDTRTGKSWVVEHRVTFEACDAWCHGGSCMVYAPFEARYTYGSDRESCLRNEPSNEVVVAKHLGDPAGPRPREADRSSVDVEREQKASDPPPESEVVLDGRRTEVRWSDGDSLVVLDGPHAESNVRLAGFNTLESYGPVHFWGGFDGAALHDLADEATAAARAGEWTCEKLEGSGGYDRLLVRCPELTRELVGRGLAHVFHVGGGDPDPALVTLQLDAQEARRGMWREGIPARIVTSLHSAREDQGDGSSYNRVCDTATGRSWTVDHELALEPCDAWCHGGSCMVYVPYERRYSDDTPYCVHTGEANRLVAPPWLGTPMDPDEGHAVR
ncbi:MAG: thermonuclease family protein [Myxococcota bacterium]